MTLVDTNLLIDLIKGDPHWAPWSAAALTGAGSTGPLVVNDVVFAELSIGFASCGACEDFLAALRIDHQATPRAALFEAGRAFQAYRRGGGARTGVLPDFFIGAHALVAGLPLITRDPRRYRAHFPGLTLITPQSGMR